MRSPLRDGTCVEGGHAIGQVFGHQVRAPFFGDRLDATRFRGLAKYRSSLSASRFTLFATARKSRRSAGVSGPNIFLMAVLMLLSGPLAVSIFLTIRWRESARRLALGFFAMV
jgi:hypothetical protein